MESSSHRREAWLSLLFAAPAILAALGLATQHLVAGVDLADPVQELGAPAFFLLLEATALTAVVLAVLALRCRPSLHYCHRAAAWIALVFAVPCAISCTALLFSPELSWL